jgi:gliding motility-associated protein GldL
LVIVGAMFKILYLPFAAEMLGLGMTVEAILFALGVFDKPHKEYEWDKVFNFDNAGGHLNAGGAIAAPTNVANKVQQEVVLPKIDYSGTIDEVQLKSLSNSIKNLNETASQLGELSKITGVSEKFLKNIDSAAVATAKFAEIQEALNAASKNLNNSYDGISDGMEQVEKGTRNYAEKVDNINKNLGSINTIYEIQIKNIQSQNEGLTKQSENVGNVNVELGKILNEISIIKAATTEAAKNTENYQLSTAKLSQQVADLNNVYGNMLNALN